MIIQILPFYSNRWYKIPNLKHQITNKSQISIFNDQNLPDKDIVWIFEFWSLEFVWYLGFDIWNFNKAIKLRQSKSPLGITKAWSYRPGSLWVLRRYLHWKNGEFRADYLAVVAIHTVIRFFDKGRVITFLVELWWKFKNPLWTVFDAVPASFTAIFEDMYLSPGNLYFI